MAVLKYTLQNKVANSNPVSFSKCPILFLFLKMLRISKGSETLALKGDHMETNLKDFAKKVSIEVWGQIFKYLYTFTKVYKVYKNLFPHFIRAFSYI